MSAPAYPRFIYLAGCDGSGKSTQARLLLEHLRRQGLRARGLWLRFPFFFSAPFLAYARWRGFSWYEPYPGGRHGYWDFSRSWILSKIFPWFFLFDALLAAIVKIYIPLWADWTIVCERFVLDMLVDLALATADYENYRHYPGKLFLRLLPQESKTLILMLDAETIKARRFDLNFDKHLEIRLFAFQRLIIGLGLDSLSTCGSITSINNEIKEFVHE